MIKNLKERAETPLKIESKPTPTGWVDLLTGKSINLDDPENEKCPSCGKYSFTGDAYHQAGKCRSCGFFHPWDD